MSLTNCSRCQYFDLNPHHSGDILCGLNPAYATTFKRLHSLDDYTKGCIPIDSCSQFELNPALEEKSITLSLSVSQWQQFIRESNDSSVTEALNHINLKIPLTLEQWQRVANASSIPHVRLTLEEQGIKPQRDPWIQVDSSCIDAIAYLPADSTLKVRFHSGYIYQYDQVSYDTFLDFYGAHSKGRFFNHHIKDVYPYRLI